MKLIILDRDGKEKGNINLPLQFSEEIRTDIIQRAVISIQNNKRQPYGAFSKAGKRPSAKLSKRRRDYKTSYGHAISRVPRKTLSRRGTRMYWVGAFAPGTVGGRRAHPPKPEKNWKEKINEKERKKAIRSALSACVIKDIVKKRGHIIPENYPFALSNDFESLEKTKDVVKSLEKLGFSKELERCSKKKIRAGKGKRRGRPYKKKKGVLFVVSKKCKLINSARNIPGVDVVLADSLNAEVLAPGGAIGRVTLLTEDAIKFIGEKRLFVNGGVK